MGEDKKVRPDWDTYWLEKLPSFGTRATCDRGQSAALIISPGNTIVTAGYVGAPSGMPHCDDVGHLFEDTQDVDGKNKARHCIRTIHAEQNAIYQAAEEGKAIQGCTIYCTMFPCFRCAMAIIRVKIKRVVAQHDYHKSHESKCAFSATNIVWSAIDSIIPYKDLTP